MFFHGEYELRLCMSSVLEDKRDAEGSEKMHYVAAPQTTLNLPTKTSPSKNASPSLAQWEQ